MAKMFIIALCLLSLAQLSGAVDDLLYLDPEGVKALDAVLTKLNSIFAYKHEERLRFLFNDRSEVEYHGMRYKGFEKIREWFRKMIHEEQFSYVMFQTKWDMATDLSEVRANGVVQLNGNDKQFSIRIVFDESFQNIVESLVISD
ncbi:unnamed protein product [Caenorhabditis auriculariae]|uniref:Nuclear transport factor 2 family protein n=1 Tax=Caenorhabditis auriculariae TaxID=2777116 RepID=A0A8S1H653_9PELO|nr:unnamed protein product [Caenorhabditis auriculariae]